MREFVYVLIISTCAFNAAIAQHNNIELPLSINPDGTAPHSSAILDLQSTDKGILIPRTDTASVNGGGVPARGLMIFQETDGRFYFYDGGKWIRMTLDIETEPNILIGPGAGGSFTTGVDNIAIGRKALQQDYDHSGNVAIGAEALSQNGVGATEVLHANHNSAIGHMALKENTYGFYNSALGYKSLASNISGARNNAFGALALMNNTTGAANSAFGIGALYKNITGNTNNAFGVGSMELSLDGSDNSAFGIASLSNNQEDQNSAFGN